MSLATDSIFISALQSNSELQEKLTEYIDDDDNIQYDETPRLYGTAIGLPDDDADNVPVPYVIVTFDGLTNEQPPKDDPLEGETDSVQVSVEVTAKNREQLADITHMVRDTIHDYFTEDVGDDRTALQYSQLSAERVTYDADKPCYWQLLRYECNVINQ